MTARPAGSSASGWTAPEPDAAVQADYARLVGGDYATGPAGTITFCVYTTDVSLGRGDIYVAAGLGRSLVRRGWGVRFLARGDWQRRLDDCDAVIAMLPDYDPAWVAEGIPAIAWTRNATEIWSAAPNLALYDMVLSSSSLPLETIRQHYDGPTGILPIGVDEELFHAEGGAPRSAITTSVNHWGRERALHKALRTFPDDAGITWFCDPERLEPALQRFCVGMASYFALPAAYRRSLLVLDDMANTALPYGNINSRLFEALSAGALVLTNGAVGLPDLGLTEVPVYRTGEDLAELINHYRANPDAALALATRLREIVRTRHTFDHRAEALLEYLPQARRSSASRRRTLTYLADPAQPGLQRVLYGGLRSAGIRAIPARHPVEGLVPRDDGGDLSHRILHVQGVGALLAGTGGPFSAYGRAQRVQTALTEFRSRGGRLVWSTHRRPEPPTGRDTAETDLVEHLAATADLVLETEGHPPPDSAPSGAAHTHRRPWARCSYLGVYPDFVGRAEARRRLGVDDSQRVVVVLCGWLVDPDLARVLAAAESALSTQPALHLLVPAWPGPVPERDRWLPLAEAYPRLRLGDDPLPDPAVQLWLRSADAALIDAGPPYDSAAADLALGFGVPLIVPGGNGPPPPALDPRWDRAHTCFVDGPEPDALARELAGTGGPATPAALASARRAGLSRTAHELGTEFAALLGECLG